MDDDGVVGATCGALTPVVPAGDADWRTVQLAERCADDLNLPLGVTDLVFPPGVHRSRRCRLCTTGALALALGLTSAAPQDETDRAIMAAVDHYSRALQRRAQQP